MRRQERCKRGNPGAGGSDFEMAVLWELRVLAMPST